jgi:hypothetical protein
MNTIQFLAEWALRSSILILSGSLLLWALRVKDPSIRLAAWTAMLCGSLAMPALAMSLPNMPLPTMPLPKMPSVARRVPARPAEALPVVSEATPVLDRTVQLTRTMDGDGPPREASWQGAGVPRRFDWAIAAMTIYIAVAAALLLRLCAGLALGLRLLRGSRATGRVTEGIEIRESDRVAAPVALGIARPAIVLPGDWRRWDGAKLEAVLAHERSHIRRHDPAVQLLSAIHRALVWHSPLSWFLHRRIVRVAEEVSDDAAMAVTRDRASYAEFLLEFMRRGAGVANWHGVAMARYGQPEKRIHRILNGTALSGGVTRWSVASILALGAPLAYVAAAAHPRSAPQARAAAMEPVAEMAAAAPVSTAPVEAAAPQAATRAANAQAAPVQAARPRQSGTIRRYMIFSGNSTSGSWDSRDPVDQEGLRARFGRNFAWFRQAGNEYVVTDAGVLGELQEAMKPQNEVNRMQSEVNIQQAAVGVLQAGVNSQQSEVNALQQEVNRRQDLVDRIQASANKEDTEALIQKLEAAIRELRAAKGYADQETVNRRQAQVNEAQARVNQEQGKVNEQQHKVNDEQGRVSAVYSGRIEEILDSAVRRNLAQQLM